MATNEIFQGYRMSVACSDPTTPTSGSPVRYGTLTGVALTDEGDGGNAATETTVDFGPTTYDLSCKGVNDSGNSAIVAGDTIFYVDADTPKLSKKSSGYFFGVALEGVGSGSTDTIKVAHIPSPGSGTLGSGTVGATQLATDSVTTAKIADGDVTVAKLEGNLQKGFIPLDITTVKLIAANAIGNTTEGMLPDGNTAPSLARVNGATDKALRLIWAASSSVEVQFPSIPKPPDLDDGAALTLHLMMAKDTNTDNAAVVAASIWDGVGDTNAGGNTDPLAAATLAEYTVALAAGDLAAAPGFLNIGLTPGAHTTDAIYLYAAWIEYTRKGA